MQICGGSVFFAGTAAKTENVCPFGFFSSKSVQKAEK